MDGLMQDLIIMLSFGIFGIIVIIKHFELLNEIKRIKKELANAREIGDLSKMQNDIIHEAGHVYYGLLKDTPLMKRIKKLLVKSNIYKTTKVFYPELVALDIDGKNITVGEFFAEEKFKNKISLINQMKKDLKKVKIDLKQKIIL